MPAAARAWGVSRRWVVVAGCVTSDLASPRLFEMSTTRRASSRVNAAALARSAGTHLPLGQVVLRVARQVRVTHRAHGCVLLEPARDTQRTGALVAHAQP